jgi:hypothetical protein
MPVALARPNHALRLEASAQDEEFNYPRLALGHDLHIVEAVRQGIPPTIGQRNLDGRTRLNVAEIQLIYLTESRRKDIHFHFRSCGQRHIKVDGPRTRDRIGIDHRRRSGGWGAAGGGRWNGCKDRREGGGEGGGMGPSRCRG